MRYTHGVAWNLVNSFDRNAGSVFPPSWPNEMLVKVMSSLNYSDIVADRKNISKVLEVGIFSGNNSRFLIENNYQLKGSEINDEMIELCTSNLNRLNYKTPEVRVGNNTSLDFDSNEFDMLISINTIHYSPMDESAKAIEEFSRVIRTGGWAIIETPASRHFAVEQSFRHGELNWEWKAGGFRQGERFGFFDSKDHFKNALSGEFSKVNICHRTVEYGNVTLDFWMAICRK